MAAPIPVFIRWVDSAKLGETNWTLIESFTPIGETICESLGWIIHEDLEQVFIAGHISEEEYGGIWQIPRVAIKDLKYLSI
jgi:hypothetical protein